MFYVKEYLDYLKNNKYSSGTIKMNKYAVHNFKKYLTENKVFDIQNLTSQVVLGYLDQVKLKLKEPFERIYCIKKYLNFLEDSEIIFLNPIKNYPNKRLKRKKPNIFSKNEIFDFLAKVDVTTKKGLRTKAILELQYSSGLRPLEIVNLKILDIDFMKGILFLRKSKRRKQRFVPVGSEAIYWIQKYITKVHPEITNQNIEYLFVSLVTGKMLKTNTIFKIIRQEIINQKVAGISTYAIRATCATHLFSNGMDLFSLQKLLGHKSVSTTEYYLRINDQELIKAITESHPRNKMKNKIYLNYKGVNNAIK